MLFVARLVDVSTRGFMAKRHVAYGVATQPEENLRRHKGRRGARNVCDRRPDEKSVSVTHVYAWFTPGTVGTVAE